MSQLPDIFSDFIEVALNDLIKCEVDPHYSVTMDSWHLPLALEPVCEVCLGGSVIAQTLEKPVNLDVSPSDFTATVRSKLLALDSLRSENLPLAAAEFYQFGLLKQTYPRDEMVRIKRKNEMNYSSYENDANDFKAWLRMIIADLREIGL